MGNASEPHDSRSDTRGRNMNRSEWNSKRRRTPRNEAIGECSHNLNRRNTYEVLGSRSGLRRLLELTGCASTHVSLLSLPVSISSRLALLRSPTCNRRSVLVGMIRNATVQCRPSQMCCGLSQTRCGDKATQPHTVNGMHRVGRWITS